MEIIYTLDQIDEKLVQLLQKNAEMTAAQLSETLNLSASQIGRRKQRLEEAGIISGYHAKIDPNKVNLNVQAFVQVQMQSHGASYAQQFRTLVEQHPEIVSTWTLTGEADYLLRVYCQDLRALNRLIHEILLAHPTVARVQSQIVMDQIKADAPLPI